MMLIAAIRYAYVAPYAAVLSHDFHGDAADDTPPC